MMRQGEEKDHRTFKKFDTSRILLKIAPLEPLVGTSIVPLCFLHIPWITKATPMFEKVSSKPVPATSSAGSRWLILVIFEMLHDLFRVYLLVLSRESGNIIPI